MNFKTLFASLFILSSTIPAFADPTNGPQWAEEVVAANGTVSYYIAFNAEEAANVDLVGSCDHTQDIDLWVYDENDNLIASSTRAGCNEAVEFYPIWTGRFKIVVENRNHPYDTAYRIDAY